MKKNIELLAPAGSFEALKAAVAAGADAIYLGGNRFGARAYANNFDNQTLIEAIQFAHIYDVKIYVTLNTIIYDDEIESIIQYVEFLYNHDVDAVITQDLGLLSLIRTHFPDLEVHSSTQMTTHNKEGAEFLKELGVERVVLARENTLEEIALINKQIEIDTEVFVHGALCVCYSGQCLMSGLIGGRSGNRGKCAQPCRKKYKLLRNNEIVYDDHYVISPKDLCTIDNIGQIIDAGVTSFKIEGRMKSPEYVSIVVSKYRKAIDLHLGKINTKITENDQQELTQIFNRGFTRGFIFDESGDKFINLYKNNHSGLFIGVVIGSSNNKVKVKLNANITVSDGIYFKGTDKGMTISRIMINKQLVELAKKHDIIELDTKESIAIGTEVYRSIDSQLVKKAETLRNDIYQKIGIKAEACFSIGKPPMLKLTDDHQHVVEVYADFTVENSKKNSLDEQTVIKQLSKLKDTAYTITEFHISIEDSLFVPMGVINNLRREAVDKLNELRKNHHKRSYKKVHFSPLTKSKTKVGLPSLSVYVRTKDQLEVAKLNGINYIYIEEELAKTLQDTSDEYYLSTYRIDHNPNVDKRYSNYLISNIAYLNVINAKNNKIVTNYNFNVTNSYAIQFLLDYHIKRVTLSYEMNESKLIELKCPNKDQLEIIVYGYQESMITRHCVFKEDCKMQCKQSSIAIVDSKKEKFKIYMDKMCNMHILNSKKLILGEELISLIEDGYEHFRLQFTVETKQETQQVIDSYLRLLENNTDHIDKLIREHKETHNFTRGFYNKEII